MKTRRDLKVVPISHKVNLELEIHLEKLLEMVRNAEITGIAYAVVRSDGCFYSDLAGNAKWQPIVGHSMAASLWVKARDRMRASCET